MIRLSNEEGLLGRSRCPRCKRVIPWHDNIPIVSFILLRGKCRACKAPISLQYPLVELATALLFVFVYTTTLQDHLSQETPLHLFNLVLFRRLFFTAVLLVIFVQDFRWYVILDIVTIPAAVLAFLLNSILGISPVSLLLAAAIGGGFFLLQYVLSQGRWIGGGDIRLGALMGCMLGFPEVLVALFLAYLAGGVFAVFLLLFGKKRFGDKLPFGTFLSLATFVALLYAHELTSWYLSVLYL